MPARRTIDDVILELDAILAEARAERSRLGYFPALYRKVTVAVKAAIEAGEFDDGERLERLDVVFADRYLEAWRAWRSGETPTGAWDVAFRAADTWPPIVLQHLLLGINAHINLDLGIAAAEVAPGAGIDSLEGDFVRVNAILGAQVDGVRRALTAIWPRLAFVDRLLGTHVQDRLINFSLETARDEAWELARRLAPLPAAAREPEIARRDRWVAKFGRVIQRPGLLTRLKLLSIRAMERGPTERVIELLAG